MEIIKGQPLSAGIVVAPIFYIKSEMHTMEKVIITNPDVQIQRFSDACEIAAKRLDELKEEMLDLAYEDEAMIFDAQKLLLFDPIFTENVTSHILRERVNAEYAVQKAAEELGSTLSKATDALIRERAVDFCDVTQLLLSTLGDTSLTPSMPTVPSMIIAETLTPGDTVRMNSDLLCAIITKSGSPNSHVAVLARGMGIPAMCGVDISPDWNGHLALLDCTQKTLIIDPDAAQIEEANRHRKQLQCESEHLKEQIGLKTVTQMGHYVNLYANVGDLSSIREALNNDAEGIGLYRSEFLYMKSASLPTEERQFHDYMQAAKLLNGRKLIIRTMDIGADKQLKSLPQHREENPALGLRGIRLCLAETAVFRTQLRALLRAAVCGNISIMFPMITSVNEILSCKQLLDEAKRELQNEHQPFGNMPIGIMIETPAAAVISDLLAKEVDFFSIGTNDLTQYTLATDRQNNHLASYYNSNHEAVLRLIHTVIENGHRAGCRVGVCGEAAGDPIFAKQLIAWGIDELSVSPSMILPLRKAIRAMNV